MIPIFLWTLADAKESISILLWSKVTIVTDGSQVSVSVHESEDLAREAAIEATYAAEGLGLWLVGIQGHGGWDDLATSIGTAHGLSIVGHQEAALAATVNSIMKKVGQEGAPLDD